MPTVLVPRASGVLCALGLAHLRPAARLRRPLIGALDALGGDALEAAFGALEEEAARRRSPGADAERRADVRYRGQSFELDRRRRRRRRARRALPRRARAALRLPRWTTSRSRSSPCGSWRCGPSSGRRCARRPPPDGGPVRERRDVCVDGDWTEVAGARPRRAGRGLARSGPGDRRVRRGDVPRARPAGPAQVDDAGTLVLERGAMSTSTRSTLSVLAQRPRRGSPRRWAPCWSAAPTRPTSRSGATARPRCSTPTAGWSRRPRTSRCTSARCRRPSRR